MKQRYWILTVSLLLLALLGTLFVICDTAISLDYARMHSTSLKERCLLLARLAEPTTLVGQGEASVSEMLGPDILVKAEDGAISVENLYFKTKDGKITGIDAVESCR